jgi:hypothetical protein
MSPGSRNQVEGASPLHAVHGPDADGALDVDVAENVMTAAPGPLISGTSAQTLGKPVALDTSRTFAIREGPLFFESFPARSATCV